MVRPWVEAIDDGFSDINEATQGSEKWAEGKALTEAPTKYWGDTEVGPTSHEPPTPAQAGVEKFLLWQVDWWRAFLLLMEALSPLEWPDS